jgi:hypothetical protein
MRGAMPVTALCITVDNHPGNLQDVCEILERNDIDIKALSAYADKEDMPISLVVDATDKAYGIIKDKNYHIMKENVLAVEVPHHPGGLNSVLKLINEEDIHILALYPSINKKNNKAIFILKTDNIDKTENILKDNWIQCADHDAF